MNSTDSAKTVNYAARLMPALMFKQPWVGMYLYMGACLYHNDKKKSQKLQKYCDIYIYDDCMKSSDEDCSCAFKDEDQTVLQV